MLRQLFNKLLVGLKRELRRSDYMNRRKALRLAKSSKRLDICASQVASCLHLAGHPSVENKVCLEIGSGWVLTHALVFYLLGAKKVIATDLTPCAMPEVLSIAVNQAIESIPRDLLAPFANYTSIRSRMDRLKRIDKFDFDCLSELGIEYVSPLDLAKTSLDIGVDFFFSNSVLEHVPVRDVEEVLNSLNKCLNSGGAMIHCIHLEDHRSSRTAPFDFLAIPNNQYTQTMQSERGNRIRVSEWANLLGRLEKCVTSDIYSYSREDVSLTDEIDAAVRFESEADLRVTHVGFYTRKLH